MADTVARTFSVPFGVVVPGSSRAYVAGQDETIEMLDLESGELAGVLASDSTPVDADSEGFVAVRKPAPGDPGQVVVGSVASEGLELAGTCPIVDVTSEHYPGGVAELTNLQPSISKGRASVTATLAHRYLGGAAPSDELLDAAFTKTAVTVIIDRATGETIEHKVTPVRNSDRTTSTSRRSTPRVGSPRGEDLAKADLESGAQDPVVVDEQILYSTVETDLSEGMERHFLKSTPVTGSDVSWSRLMRTVELSPEPPPPP